MKSFLLITTSLFISLQTLSSEIESRIVGGDLAQAGDFPFIVSVQNNKRHDCGGTIVGDRWILTAAHCVSNSRMRVVVGITDLRDRSRRNTYRVRKKVIHPKFDDGTLDYDYALLRLRSKLDIPPVRLNKETIPQDAEQIFTVAGWGRLSDESYDYPNQLQKVDVPFVSTSQCQLTYHDRITSRMICAGYPEGGKDSCNGDSGGPLLYRDDQGYVLAGVVSWGWGCARPSNYGVYSKVSAVVDWISKVIK